MVILAIVTCLLINIILINSETNNDKISSEVYKSLEDKNNVEVIVKLKQVSSENIAVLNDSEISKEDIYKNYVATEVSLQELNQLKKNTNVESIVESHPISALLQDSVPLINATQVWPMQVLNINLTGTNETICIIDSGINFLHGDLIGKNKSCIIDCFNKVCVENCSLADDNGHGTHVAGIAAASLGINGVAPNASLIGIKVLGSDGLGSGNDLDLSRAIDYCISKNVSVISMSLGTGSLYTEDCSSLMGSWTDSINSAFAKNISVIASSGNDGNTLKISSPACIKNTTSVGATDKSDVIASYSNRNTITDLLAPGGSSGNQINSTSSSGGYTSKYGTSMSAPHVAGAFAIIRQAFKLMNNRTPTPLEIQNILNSTGKIIYDSATGINFSRINIYSAVLSLDNIYPNVSLVYPLDNHLNSSNNQTFICNASDNFGLKNMTINIWNSSSLYYNNTAQISGNNYEAIFNVTNLSSGSYKWNCLAYDLNNNSAYANSNFSFNIFSNLSVFLIPANNTFIKENQTNFSCFSQTTDFNLRNITFNILNSSYYLIYNTTTNITGISNYTNFTYSFNEEGIYMWNCLVYNNISQSAFSGNNTITFDTLNPIISEVADSVAHNFATISWISNENANYSIDYGTENSLGHITSDSNFITSHSALLNELTASTTYYYNISSCDRANNCITNGSYNFTTSAAPVIQSASTGGGGGGGGSTYVTYVPTKEQISAGYTKELNKEDRIKFTFFDSNTVEHTLALNEVKQNSVNITIRSNPINLLLGIGQSAKLNLTSSNYYDIYVKLESLENNKAKITMQIIHEEIPKQIIEKVVENPINKSYEENSDKKENIQKDLNFLSLEIKKIKVLMYVLLIGLLGFILFIIVKRIEIKKDRKEKIKENHKEIFNKHLNPKDNERII